MVCIWLEAEKLHRQVEKGFSRLGINMVFARGFRGKGCLCWRSSKQKEDSFLGSILQQLQGEESECSFSVSITLVGAAAFQMLAMQTGERDDAGREGYLEEGLVHSQCRGYVRAPVKYFRLPAASVFRALVLLTLSADVVTKSNSIGSLLRSCN